MTCRFNPKYLPVLILAMVLLATVISFAQTERLIFNQINQLRGPKHQLTYDSAKQKQVDWYASTNGFKRMIHSSLNCGEILAGSHTGDDFVQGWLGSPSHKKSIFNKQWKSMACRVVEIRPGYYQAVVQFFD